MKKAFSAFLLFLLIFLNPPAFGVKYQSISSGYDEIKKLGTDTVKVRKGEFWGVLSVENEEILPVQYEKIKYINLKPNSKKEWGIFLGKDKNSWVATTPARAPQDFFKNTFKYSNKNTWLKYTNYPTQGILALKQGPKYGFTIITDKEARVIDPQFDDVYFQDSKSAIYQQFGISFSDPDAIIVKKGKKWGIVNSKGETVVDFQYDNVIMANAAVDESVEVTSDSILFNFKGIKFPEQNKLIAKKDGVTRVIDKRGNILLEKPTAKNEIQFKDFEAKDFLNQVYKENNEKAFVKYINYPTRGIYRYKSDGKYGLVINKDEGNKIISAIYQDFMFQDSNSAIFQQLYTSFSNPNRILAKKDDKWGIIDESNNAVVDFQYDNIIMLESIASEDIEINDDGVVFKYKDITFPQSNLLLVQKGNNFGVIDRNGNEIIPLKFSFIKTPKKPKIEIDGARLIPKFIKGTKQVDRTITGAAADTDGTSSDIASIVAVVPLVIIGAPLLLLLFLAMAGDC